MSSVPVDITWTGATPVANPAKVILKLSAGHNQVKWSSAVDFVIAISGTKINAKLTGSDYTAHSQVYTTPGTIPYVITLADGSGGADPEIEIQT